MGSLVCPRSFAWKHIQWDVWRNALQSLFGDLAMLGNIHTGLQQQQLQIQVTIRLALHRGGVFYISLLSSLNSGSFGTNLVPTYGKMLGKIEPRGFQERAARPVYEGLIFVMKSIYEQIRFLIACEYVTWSAFSLLC